MHEGQAARRQGGTKARRHGGTKVRRPGSQEAKPARKQVSWLKGVGLVLHCVSRGGKLPHAHIFHRADGGPFIYMYVYVCVCMYIYIYIFILHIHIHIIYTLPPFRQSALSPSLNFFHFHYQRYIYIYIYI